MEGLLLFCDKNFTPIIYYCFTIEAKWNQKKKIKNPIWIFPAS